MDDGRSLQKSRHLWQKLAFLYSQRKNLGVESNRGSRLNSNLHISFGVRRTQIFTLDGKTQPRDELVLQGKLI